MSSPSSSTLVSIPSDNSMDDFIVVDQDLPHRPKQHPEVDLQLYPLAANEGSLISIKPPKSPKEDIPHVPVDLVLVIDVSSSMSSAAPLPDTQDVEERESAGLSILDLCKHAARTIMAPMNQNDRLSLVTFSSDAKVVQSLTFMNKEGKERMETKIESLTVHSSTNLWSGIKTGLSVFEKASLTNNVQGMFVLTDGMPNHMCPPQGYVAKLKPMLANMASSKPQVPSIHTFGFGYDMWSELLMSIAEVGNGNYAFMPDAGMIGTIFVHAMANMCSTFCVNADLEIKTSEASSISCSTVFNIDHPDPTTVRLRLGNLQYGQSRDLIITSNKPGKRPIIVRASLKYQYRVQDAIEQTTVSATLNKVSARLPQSVSDYHVLRSHFCTFLASFFPFRSNGEHRALSDERDSFEFGKQASQFDPLVARIQASPHIDDPNVKSLLTDLIGEDPAGQVRKAISIEPPANYYRKWGRRYLPSLLHAHARQTCNSFKDPGPLRYGIDSPLFIKCRDEMDAVFENLPVPKPSRPEKRRYDGTSVPHSAPHSMARYHSSGNPCFEGQCEVRMGDGSLLAVNKLAPGMQVLTPVGLRKVVAVVKTAAKSKGKDELCRVGNLWVTPYHPIKQLSRWVFPADVAEETKLCRSSVYSVLLAYSNDTDAHAIEVGGQVAVTLGHGVRQGDSESDARAHEFFGNYVKVVRSLMKVPKGTDGQLVSVGVERSQETGLVCGFKATEVKESVIKARNRKCAVGRSSGRYGFRARKVISVSV